MRPTAGAALMIALALLFWIANRDAYRGYFQSEDLEAIGRALETPPATFAEALAAPRMFSRNFRPVPALYFRWMSRFGPDFPKYVLPIHALHLLNVWLIWLIVRRLGAGRFAAGAGALFFAFNMVLFDVLWKPMYIHDLLCATFCLASIWGYLRRWLPASFVAFWLAYKSKELAIMLPVVLACCEYWFGKRRWKPLVPFFATAMLFAVEGVWFNPNRNHAYRFYFGPRSVLQAGLEYADNVLLFPFAGFLLPALPIVFRDRRVWLGVAAALSFFVPLVFLKNNVHDAYCYLPLAGVAIAVCGIAASAGARYRVLVCVFFLVWIPWNEFQLHLSSRRALAVAEENRAYVEAAGAAARAHPGIRTFLYEGAPFAMHPRGILGALRIFRPSPELRLISADDPGVFRAAQEPLVLLGWDANTRQLSVVAHEPGQADASYIRMNPATPVWQLRNGWYALENDVRRTGSAATAQLYRPQGALRFEFVAEIPPELVRAGGTELEVWLDGRLLGSARFDAAGHQTMHWDLEPRPAGTVEVGFRTRPLYRAAPPDGRVLGIAVAAFGFPAEENP